MMPNSKIPAVILSALLLLLSSVNANCTVLMVVKQNGSFTIAANSNTSTQDGNGGFRATGSSCKIFQSHGLVELHAGGVSFHPTIGGVVQPTEYGNFVAAIRKVTDGSKSIQENKLRILDAMKAEYTSIVQSIDRVGGKPYIGPIEGQRILLIRFDDLGKEEIEGFALDLDPSARLKFIVHDFTDEITKKGNYFLTLVSGTPTFRQWNKPEGDTFKALRAEMLEIGKRNPGTWGGKVVISRLDRDGFKWLQNDGVCTSKDVR